MNNSWECLSHFLPSLYWFVSWPANQSAFSHYWCLLMADADSTFSIGFNEVWQGQLVPTVRDTPSQLGPVGDHWLELTHRPGVSLGLPLVLISEASKSFLKAESFRFLKHLMNVDWKNVSMHTDTLDNVFYFGWNLYPAFSQELHYLMCLAGGGSWVSMSSPWQHAEKSSCVSIPWGWEN